MPIKATVIYDTPTHTPLVLRLPTFSLPQRYEIIDTISSFTAHCESLRGVARSTAQVSALWGGPPYITYNVIAKRLRCIVIWEKSPSDFDLAYDVQTCLSRLEKVVSSIVDPLSKRDPDAMALAYEQSGYALTGDSSIQFETPNAKKQRPKILAKVPSMQRRSSTLDSRKKKTGGGGGFFGKLRRNVTGGDQPETQEQEVESLSESSLRPPSEAAALSVAQYGSEDGVEVAELELPDDMFEWADFGSDTRTDDISWLTAMIRGEETITSPSVAKIRAGSTTSTPLIIPVMEEDGGLLGALPVMVPGLPTARNESQGKASSRRESKVAENTPDSVAKQRVATATPSVLPISSPLLSNTHATSSPAEAQVRGPVPASIAPGAPNRSGLGGGSMGNSPQVASTPNQSALAGGLVPNIGAVQSPTSGMRSSTATAMGLGVNAQVAGETNQAALGTSMPINMQNVASGMRPPVAPNGGVTRMGSGMGGVVQMGQQSVGAGNMQGAVSGMRPPIGPSAAMGMQMAQQQMQNGMQGGLGVQGQMEQSGVSGMQTPSVGSSMGAGAESPVPPSPMMRSVASTVTGGYGGGNIPPALAALQQDSDFAVSVLGELKDGSTGGQSGGLGRQEADDEAVRTRMNEFAVTMQAGNFTLALQQVYATLRLLRGVQPRRDRETMTCANYVLAQKILIRNAVLEKELGRVLPGSVEGVRRRVECALLTMFLAELKHLLPRHRVAAMQVAVEKNFVVGNYGMCARWLRQLLERAPERTRGELNGRLEVCTRAGEVNAQMPLSNRMCYVTLQVLGGGCGKCNVCPAVYHPQMAGVVLGQVCPTCFVGGIEARIS